MKNKIVLFLKVVLFLISVAFVIIGQDTVGRVYLLLQFAGLAGIIFLLWDYNQKFI